MRGFNVWLVVWIAFTVQALVIPFLPLPTWGRILVASIYGGLVGWGITRWKNR
jgi:hypothetical protein